MKRSLLNISILDSLLEGFQVIDYHWKYLYVNTTVANQGQSTVDRLLGKTMMECYPGIEDTYMFSQLQKCMDERVTLQFENEFVYNDGSKNWFELRIEPIPEGVFILSTNIAGFTSKKILIPFSLIYSSPSWKQGVPPPVATTILLSFCIFFSCWFSTFLKYSSPFKLNISAIFFYRKKTTWL